MVYGRAYPLIGGPGRVPGAGRLETVINSSNFRADIKGLIALNHPYSAYHSAHISFNDFCTYCIVVD